MGHKRLLESHDDVMLLQKIQLRAPYVTPLNVLQVAPPPFLFCCCSPAGQILYLPHIQAPTYPLTCRTMFTAP